MAAILAFLLLGVTGLTQVLHIMPEVDETVLGSLGHAVYGGGFFYYALQIATMAILVLAANTSFAGFPRLSSVLARDGLMPRQFMNRGDKLVFSNGIIGLTVAAILVLVAFGGEVHRLIPLYAVGVFTSFTLSQSGMVVRWFRLRTPGWQRKAVMNGVGAFMTGVVTLGRPRHQVHRRGLHRGDRRRDPDSASSTSSAATTTVSPTSWSHRTRRSSSGWARWRSPSRGPPSSCSSPRSTS